VLIEVAWGHGTGMIQDGDAAEGEPPAHGIRRVGNSTGEAIGPLKALLVIGLQVSDVDLAWRGWKNGDWECRDELLQSEHNDEVKIAFTRDVRMHQHRVPHSRGSV
jgi:hypothetical protein